MVSWSLSYRWKSLPFERMITDIISYILKARDVAGVISFLRDIQQGSYDYRDKVDRWVLNITGSRTIWLTMLQYYENIIEFDSINIVHKSMVLFDLAAKNYSYREVIDKDSKLIDIKFIQCVKDPDLFNHLYDLFSENSLGQDLVPIYEEMLNAGNFPDAIVDKIFAQHMDVTFKMVIGCADHQKVRYFEMAFIRANFNHEFTKEIAAQILSAVCSTIVDSQPKYEFLMEILRKTQVKVMINHQVFDKVYQKIQISNHKSEIFKQFLSNVDRLCRVDDSVFILTSKIFMTLMKIVREIRGQKYYFEDDLKRFVLTQIERRRFAGKKDIVCTYELVKIYSECDYQKFPFPIKIEITMKEFEEICKSKPDVRLMTQTYDCLKEKTRPSTKCLENVTLHKSCDSAVKFLLSKGAILSVQCIRNVMSHYKSNVVDDLKWALGEFDRDRRHFELNERFRVKTDARVMVVQKEKEISENNNESVDQDRNSIVNITDNQYVMII